MKNAKVSSNTKRQEYKQKRRKAQQRKRMTTVLAIGGVVVVIVALLALPSLRNAAAPIGTVIPITPVAHPNANGTSMGDPNAPVKIVVYEDFQCPACQNYTETTEKSIIETYVATGKAYYTFRQFPIVDSQSTTKESHQAANASLCAAEQGRFWDYHDMIYANWKGENEGNLSDKRLKEFARVLGLDTEKFNSCFSANTYKDQIQADLAAGQQAQVTGTPTIFVNGQAVNPGYVPSFEDMQKAIEAALGG
jgi:protein-disulfide isomerase